MKKLIVYLLLVSICGCCNKTMIKSTPPGATVYIDGENVGKTPYEYSDMKIGYGGEFTLWLKHPGYKDFVIVIHKDEEWSTAGCIFGSFLIVPLLWARGYKPERTFVLEK